MDDAVRPAWDQKTPNRERRRIERQHTPTAAETLHEGHYRGDGTKMCELGCGGYVLAGFRHGALVRVELHHLQRRGCVQRVEPLDLRVWLGNLPRHIELSRAERGIAAEPEHRPARAPSRVRRDLTPEGRVRR